MCRSYRFFNFIADIAFVDRADIKAYVGPPTLQARYEILRSCLQELMRTGILTSLQVQRVLNRMHEFSNLDFDSDIKEKSLFRFRYFGLIVLC